MPLPSSSARDFAGGPWPEVVSTRPSGGQTSSPRSAEPEAATSSTAAPPLPFSSTDQTEVPLSSSSPVRPGHEGSTASSSVPSSPPATSSFFALSRVLPFSVFSSFRRLWSTSTSADRYQGEARSADLEDRGAGDALWDSRREKYSGIRTLAILVFGLLPLLWEIQLLLPSLTGLLEMKTWVYVDHRLNQDALRESIVLPVPTSDVAFAVQRASRLWESEAERGGGREGKTEAAEPTSQPTEAGGDLGSGPVAKQDGTPWLDVHVKKLAEAKEEGHGQSGEQLSLFLFPRNSRGSSLYDQLKVWHTVQKRRQALGKGVVPETGPDDGVKDQAFHGKDTAAAGVGGLKTSGAASQDSYQPRYSSGAPPPLFRLSVGASACTSSCESFVLPPCSPSSSHGPNLSALPPQVWASPSTALASTGISDNSQTLLARSDSSPSPHAPTEGSSSSLQLSAPTDLAVLPSSSLLQHHEKEPTASLRQGVAARSAAEQDKAGLEGSFVSNSSVAERLHAGLLAVQQAAFYLHNSSYFPSASASSSSSASLTPSLAAFPATPPCYDSPSRGVFLFWVDPRSFNVTPPLLLVYSSLVIIMIRWFLLAIRSVGEALLLQNDLDSDGNLFSPATVSKPLRVVGAFSIWSLAFCVLPYGLAANEGCMRGTLQNTDVPLPRFYAYFQYSIWLAFLLVIAALRLSAYFKRLAVAAAAAEQSPRNGNQRLSSPLLFQRVAASPPTAPAASDPAPHHTGAELLPRAGVSAATAFPRDGELQSQEEISHRLPSPEAQGQTERTGQQSVGRGGDVPALETQVQTAVGGERRGAHERSRSTSISLVPGMNLRGGRQGAVGGSVFRGSVSREFSHGTLLRMGYRLCVQRLRRRMRMIWEALGSRREQFLASRYHLYQEVCSAGAFFFFIHTVSGALVVLLGQGQPWIKAVWLQIFCMFLEAWTRHHIAQAEERVQRSRRASTPRTSANGGAARLSRGWFQRGGSSWGYALVDEPQDRYLLKQMSSTYFSIAEQFFVDKVTSSAAAASLCRSCLPASAGHAHQSPRSGRPSGADVDVPLQTRASSADRGASFSRAPLVAMDAPLLSVAVSESPTGHEVIVQELSPRSAGSSSSSSCVNGAQDGHASGAPGLSRLSCSDTGTDGGSLSAMREDAAREEAAAYSRSGLDEPLLGTSISPETKRRLSVCTAPSPRGLQTISHGQGIEYSAHRDEDIRQAPATLAPTEVERETCDHLSAGTETKENEGGAATGLERRSRYFNCVPFSSEALRDCQSSGARDREETQHDIVAQPGEREAGRRQASPGIPGGNSGTSAFDGKQWENSQRRAYSSSSCPSSRPPRLSTGCASSLSSATTVCSPSSFSSPSSSSTPSAAPASPVHCSSPAYSVICSDTETNAAVCELCAEAAADAVLLPCGHGGVCEACARLVVEKEHQRARSSGGLRSFLSSESSSAPGFNGSFPGLVASLRTPTRPPSRWDGEYRSSALQLPRCPFCRQGVERVVKLDAACQSQSGCITAHTVALVIMDEHGERRTTGRWSGDRRHTSAVTQDTSSAACPEKTGKLAKLRCPNFRLLSIGRRHIVELGTPRSGTPPRLPFALAARQRKLQPQLAALLPLGDCLLLLALKDALSRLSSQAFIRHDVAQTIAAVAQQELIAHLIRGAPSLPSVCLTGRLMLYRHRQQHWLLVLKGVHAAALSVPPLSRPPALHYSSESASANTRQRAEVVMGHLRKYLPRDRRHSLRAFPGRREPALVRFNLPPDAAGNGGANVAVPYGQREKKAPRGGNDEASAALEGQSPSAGPREGERSSSLGQPFAEDQKEERDSFFSAAAVGPPPALEGVSYFSHEGFLRASLPFRHSRQMVTVINAAVNATKGGGGGGAPGSDAKKRKT